MRVESRKPPMIPGMALAALVWLYGAETGRAQEIGTPPRPGEPAPAAPIPANAPPAPPAESPILPPGTESILPPGTTVSPNPGLVSGDPLAGDPPPAPAQTGQGAAQQPGQPVRSEQGGITPPLSPFSRLPLTGFFIVQPTGPGYYSLADLLTGNYRPKPPKYPYPRFGIIAYPFFEYNWRYLQDPKNQAHDYLDFLKLIPLGNNWTFTNGGEFRYRYNNEVNSRLSGKDNVYQLTRTRIYGDLWYRDVFRLYAEFLNANTFNQDLAPLVTDRDHGDFLNLFADLKLFEYDKNPVYFRGGRQELAYGSQRLISPLDWVNTRRTFQGAKVFYRSQKFDIDAFLVQPIVPNTQHFDSVDWEQLFTGVWATYRPKAGQAIDAYYLNLDQTRPVAAGFGGQLGGFNVNTLGSRYVGNANNWLWDAEAMLQFGGWSNQGLLAKAYTTGFGYHFKNVPLTPQLWFYYDFASGDPDPGKNSVHRTFNQLFPFGHPYFGFIDVVGRQNINDFNMQLSFFPTKWITTLLQYHVFRLDSPKDALYSAGGAVLRQDPTGRSGTDVGEEIDFLVNFHLTNHQDVLLSYSHLYAGDFLRRTGSGRSPDYLYLQYSFRW